MTSRIHLVTDAMFRAQSSLVPPEFSLETLLDIRDGGLTESAFPSLLQSLAVKVAHPTTRRRGGPKVSKGSSGGHMSVSLPSTLPRMS